MKSKSPKPDILRAGTFEELKALQDQMAEALFRPLTPAYTMQKIWTDGVTRTSTLADSFIKPNNRLTSFDRLEIYNRCCWFRLLDCLYDDYPGIRGILGRRKFMALCKAYLTKHQSTSFTLRNLGSQLGAFLEAEPQWAGARLTVCLDMFRFEWAQILAFDEASSPVINPDLLLDTPPSALRLGLQPYLILLALDYAVDNFLLEVKKLESKALRGEASNTPTEAPSEVDVSTRPRLPRRKKNWLAVHRSDNQLYYKQLDADAYVLLSALRDGETLEAACVSMLNVSSRTDVDWPAQIQEWFASWSGLGWFCQRT